jgi:hypothetical protein
MHTARRRIAAFTLACLLASGLCQRLYSQEERIITPEEVKKATHPSWLVPFHYISYPHRAVSSGMESGLIAMEKHYLRQRWTRFLGTLREHGFVPVFGGTGEGTGIGGGLTFLAGKEKALQFRWDVNITTINYEECTLSLGKALGPARLILEGSYQWRPRENFYGLGQDSQKGRRTNFALRQTWSGLRYEVAPKGWFKVGAEYRWAWLETMAGTNPAVSAPDFYFPDLTGYGAQTRLQSGGIYLNLTGIRGDYRLGGELHAGASYQEGLGRNENLKYYSYEIQLEGRLPIASERSAFVGQANIELNHTVGGSDPVPFYLLPHIGGSGTLRGFRLDRFYGANLFLLSLEYRYRLHPNIEAIPFYDEGQIYDRFSDLSWLNWHRNYGIAFRYRVGTGASKSTAIRLEFGHSSEGFGFHLSFGDRPRPELRGPIRWGVYKR